MSDTVFSVSLSSSAGGSSGAFPSVSFAKGTDLSFFNLFQTLQHTPALQGSLVYQEQGGSPLEPPPVLTAAPPEEATAVPDPQAPQPSQMPTDTESIHQRAVDEEAIWIHHVFQADDAQQMDQWLVHLVQQPNGLPVPWFFQMVQQLGTNGSGSSQGQSGFSGQLMEAITKAYQSGRSIRITLENQTDLILKFHQGKVSAEFMSENPMVQATLQETVAQLRRQLEGKRLPVGEIVYREQHPDSEDPSHQQRRPDDDDSRQA